MKKLLIITVTLVAIIGTLFGTTIIGAQESIPSTKAAYYCADVTEITKAAQDEPGEAAWTQILATQVKTGTPKDLIIDVSGECALVTSAKLSGSAGSEAQAKVLVRVKVDGKTAEPGKVVFNNRLLRVEGDLTDPDGDHWIEIFIKTKSANSFNFCIQDVGSGVHDIVVQAKCVVEQQKDMSKAKAWMGLVSVVVDEVNLKTLPIGGVLD